MPFNYIHRHINVHKHRYKFCSHGHPSQMSAEFIQSMTMGSIPPKCLPWHEGWCAVGCCIRSSQLVCLEQSILTVHGSCDIQYHSTTNIIEFNITDCSEKSDSHPGTHCVSLSPCITHQVHPAPSAKTIPRMGLPLIEAGLIQTVFPNTFLIHTMRTLSLSVVCRGFDGTGLA